MEPLTTNGKQKNECEWVYVGIRERREHKTN